jgi:outer membrane protein
MAEYQANTAIAQEDVKIAQSGHRPTVSFSVAQNWYDTDFPGADNSNWLMALTTSLNVFDSGLTKSQVKQAQHGLTKAQEQARQNRDTILLEVRESYLSMREAEKRIETSDVAVHKAAEDSRIAEVRYAAGVGTNLDVLDAVLALNEAKMNYFEALYDYNISKAKLDKAMGVSVN